MIDSKFSIYGNPPIVQTDSLIKKGWHNNAILDIRFYLFPQLSGEGEPSWPLLLLVMNLDRCSVAKAASIVKTMYNMWQ